MNRADFLKSGTLLGAGTLFATANVFAQNLSSNPSTNWLMLTAITFNRLCHTAKLF